MLLNQLVLETGLTQQELAKQIGVNNTYFSKVLGAKELPSKAFKDKVEKYFNCQVEYLTPFDIIKQKDILIANLQLAYEKLYDLTCDLNTQVSEYRELVNNIKASIGAQLDLTVTYDMEAFKLNKVMEVK